jgi:hypothetical protein
VEWRALLAALRSKFKCPEEKPSHTTVWTGCLKPPRWRVKILQWEHLVVIHYICSSYQNLNADSNIWISTALICEESSHQYCAQKHRVENGGKCPIMLCGFRFIYRRYCNMCKLVATGGIVWLKFGHLHFLFIELRWKWQDVKCLSNKTAWHFKKCPVQISFKDSCYDRCMS